MPDRPADPMPDDELESYLAAISPEVDSSRSELTGRFGSAQVFQVRLPELRIEQLRRLAEAHGVPPTSLVVDWVIERLDREDPGFGSAVPRAPIAPRVRQPDPVGPINPVEQPTAAGEQRPGPPGRGGSGPSQPPHGQPSRPPTGRPARSSVGPLTQPGAVGPLTRSPARPPHPLGSGPLPPVAGGPPSSAGSLLSGVASLKTEPALDPAAAALFAPPANPLSGPPPDPRSGTASFPASSLDTGSLDTVSLDTAAFDTAAANPTALNEEFTGPALSNLPLPDRETSAATATDGEAEAEGEAGESNAVTPIFRAGSELPDPGKRRGPRHRAPEPITSLLTRRKF